VTPFPPATRVSSGVAVFADAHLGQAEGDADDFLAALSDVAGRGMTTIVLLGDIFDYFIGDAKFETPLISRVLSAFSDLAAAGVSLRYVEGNRDFFLAGSRYVAPFAAYGDADGLEIGEIRYAFVHGDRVNTRDLPYRFWRLLSKNPLSRGALHLIPGPVARAIVKKTEERLYRTNFKHKTKVPEVELLAEGRRARNAGYDRLLVGHFHVERLVEAADAVTRVLPAWLEERKHAEIDTAGNLKIVEEPTASRGVKRKYGFA
jgi:UDP-2,3-diacylglucosamine hydrolase